MDSAFPQAKPIRVAKEAKDETKAKAEEKSASEFENITTTFTAILRDHVRCVRCCSSWLWGSAFLLMVILIFERPCLGTAWVTSSLLLALGILWYVSHI